MGRIIAIGDKRQAIYGFRGADTAAIETLKTRLNATTLPLKVSYRCAKSIIACAQQIEPELRALDSAIDGNVRTIKEDELYGEVKPSDFILCRVTLPLIQKCFALLKQGRKAIVRGKDIGKQIAMIIDEVTKGNDSMPIADCINAIVEYGMTHTARLLDAKKELEASNMTDRVDSLLVFFEGCNTITEVKAKIDATFSDDVEGIVLSTIHKAKGLEANRVFIIHPEKLPHPRATLPWQQEQETNLKYVAITRAKSELIFVTTQKN